MYLLTGENGVLLKKHKQSQVVECISIVGQKTTIERPLMQNTIGKIKEIEDGTCYDLPLKASQ